MKEFEQIPSMSEGDVETGGINMTGWLDEDEELLSGAEELTVTELDPVEGNELTIENIIVNSVPVRIRGKTVAAGKAVLFSVSNQLKIQKRYRLHVMMTSNSLIPRIANRLAKFTVK